MVKKKKANGSGTTKPNIAKLKETYVGQYVNTPLSFWDDGVTSVKKGSSVEMVLGKITTVKMAKKKTEKVTADVHYAPTEDEGDTVCALFLNVINEMILPLNFHPPHGSFFDETTQSEHSDVESVENVQEKNDDDTNDKEGDKLADFFDPNNEYEKKKGDI